MSRLWRTPPFATVFLVGFLQEVAFALLVNLPGRFQELGLSEATIGVAYSLSALCSLALRPGLGRILDKVHRRTVMRVGGVVNIAAIAALAMIDFAGPTLWVAFIAQRLVMVGLFTTLLTYAADSIPAPVRTYGLAIFGLSGLIPMAISNLGGDILLERAGYQGVIAFAALVALASWVLVWRLPLLPILEGRPRRSFWAVSMQRDLLPVWWVTLLFAMAMETLFVFTRTYITDRRIGSLGAFFLAYGGMAVVTRLFADRLVVFAERRVVFASVISQALALGLLASAGHVAVMLAGAGLAGGAHGIVFPILSSQVVSRARTSERGSAVAIFTSLFDLGLLLVAPVVGALIDWRSYQVAYTVVALVLAGGAVVFVFWDRRLVLSISRV